MPVGQRTAHLPDLAAGHPKQHRVDAPPVRRAPNRSDRPQAGRGGGGPPGAGGEAVSGPALDHPRRWRRLDSQRALHDPTVSIENVNHRLAIERAIAGLADAPTARKFRRYYHLSNGLGDGMGGGSGDGAGIPLGITNPNTKTKTKTNPTPVDTTSNPPAQPTASPASEISPHNNKSETEEAPRAPRQPRILPRGDGGPPSIPPPGTYNTLLAAVKARQPELTEAEAQTAALREFERSIRR